MSNFRIHTLGCGSAKPSVRHQPSSTVVEYHGNLYMVDCGENAQQAFMRAGLKQSRLSHIFLTHLHGDHVFGLFGLLGTLALQSKGGHITIHTFQEGKGIIGKVNEYFNRDMPFEIIWDVIDPHESRIVLETPRLEVSTVPLRHRIDCVGYIFREKPKERHIIKEMCDFHKVPVSKMQEIRLGADFVREDGRVISNAMLTRDATPSLSYAHLSDTAYFPGLAEAVGPVDLMMHETTYLEEHAALAAPRGHSTAVQAAMTARDAGAKWLLTGHYSSRYRSDEGFKKEAEEIFPNVILNKEGLCVDLEKL